jgi:hypothetical protein
VDATTTALLSVLNGQRRHVLACVDGLTPEELRRPVLPSGWSCVALVQHLALDVERFWFRQVVAGELVVEGSGWDVADDTEPVKVLELYRDEAERADAVVSGTPLEDPLAHWPVDRFGDWRMPDLRAVLLHVITETACHAGHLDAARELIDGAQFLVLD